MAKKVLAAVWNTRHQINDRVYYWQDGRNRPPRLTRLRSLAWDTSIGSVVLVFGVDGGVPLELVEDADDIALCGGVR